MRLTSTEISNQLNMLPEHIRNAVMSFDWAGEVMDIARTHDIQIDEIEEFRQETLKVILGIAPAEAYEKNIIAAMGIDAATAALLVDEANERIFLELQKRAFRKDGESSQSQNDEEDDRYLEPISHADVKNLMTDAGIELLDDDDLEMTSDSGIDHDEEAASTHVSRNDGGSKTISRTPSQPGNDLSLSYREPIEEKDLRGVNKQSIDTSILKTLHHKNPERVFSDEDFSDQQPYTEQHPTLDKKIMQEPVIPGLGHIDASLNKQETIAEEKSFLQHLQEKE